jgi:DNA-binding NarL/FixJ family response regulator
MAKPRIILVDDHRILLDALKTLVEPEFEVVGLFEEAQSLIDRVSELRPDVVVLDIGIPGMNGLTAARYLKKKIPKTKLVFLTAFHDRDAASEAFKLGASGYVLKSSAGSDLIKALREVLRGGYFASEVLTEGMTGSFVQAFKRMEQKEKLTPRQKEVLGLLSSGMSMKQVAARLNITPRTVAFHKYTIMEQHEITSNAELISFAIENLPPVD